MIKFNLDARCSNGFTGLLAHGKKSRYYSVCKHNAVLSCACKPKETFNRIRLRCEGKCDKRSRETFTHNVVDNILDKYKCSMMNGVFDNENCLMTTTTTESYSNVYQSSEFYNQNVRNSTKFTNFS